MACHPLLEIWGTCPRPLMIATHAAVSNAQTRQIRVIRRSLSFNTAASLVHSYILMRLDYCNSVLAELPKFRIRQLQSILNCAPELLLTCQYSRMFRALCETLCTGFRSSLGLPSKSSSWKEILYLVRHLTTTDGSAFPFPASLVCDPWIPLSPALTYHDTGDIVPSHAFDHPPGTVYHAYGLFRRIVADNSRSIFELS